MLWDNLAIVDVETTGMWPHRDRVVEMGIVVIDRGKVMDKYSQLINPLTWMSPEISRMTGINPKDLENQPTFADLGEEIYNRLNGRLFVAHNARFDYGFIKQEFERLGVNFKAQQLCSVRLSRRLYPQEHGHSLDRIIERFHIAVENRHRALDDALVVWQFFRHLEKTMEPETLEKAKKTLIKTQSLPPLLKKEQMEALPHCPGVYLFYDEAGALLYVGKSVDLKDRIWSHFYDDLTLPKDFRIKAAVADMEIRTTAGELEALMLESKLVKELKPLFNSQLRNRSELTIVRKEKNKEGYLTLSFDRVERLTVEDIPMVAGVFKSKRQAREQVQQLAEEHHLCWHLCGLENTKPCFGYHLEKCRGACLNKENTISYNLRFQEAMVPHSITTWPFPGAIIINEENELTGQTARHIFDRWCYLGSGEAEIKNTEYVFDLDVYKILKNFILKNPGRVKVIKPEV